MTKLLSSLFLFFLIAAFNVHLRAGEPVILLTGFEPFGAERSPNPSWEGVKALDGQSWNGHRLVCRQMQVLWGQPLRQLETWIDEFHPVAVFSFGQGGYGSFALETVANNRRSQTRDNDGQRPPSRNIIAEGPESFPATIDAEAFVSSLAGKGYTIRRSTNAGRYLCEETLYTLEYLKRQRQLDATVLFCHVPPLGSSIQGRRITAAYVQQFVEGALDTWLTMNAENPQTEAATEEEQNPPPRAAADARRAEVEKLIRHYFQTWSNQDIEAYGECFDDDAVIQMLDSRKRVSTSTLRPFLAGQRQSHRSSPHRLIEAPVTINITFEALLARAVVYWKLTAGPRTDYGYDHFTLVKSADGEWKIVNLVYYLTKRTRE